MDIEAIKRLEHICLESNFDLQEFGKKFEIALSLPTMEYDFENETEWLTVDVEKINYNVSRPLEKGTLHEWDDTTPENCNFGIVLSIHKDHPLVLDNVWVDKTVATVCKQIASAFNTTVYHHRTFIFGTGKSERKNIVYSP